jgi:hypothetical protein
MAWKIGERLPDGRWVAPAAERNKGAILEVLQCVLPPRGLVLEIGSGTRQIASDSLLPKSSTCRRTISASSSARRDASGCNAS